MTPKFSGLKAQPLYCSLFCSSRIQAVLSDGALHSLWFWLSPLMFASCHTGHILLVHSSHRTRFKRRGNRLTIPLDGMRGKVTFRKECCLWRNVATSADTFHHSSPSDDSYLYNPHAKDISLKVLLIEALEQSPGPCHLSNSDPIRFIGCSSLAAPPLKPKTHELKNNYVSSQVSKFNNETGTEYPLPFKHRVMKST